MGEALGEDSEEVEMGGDAVDYVLQWLLLRVVGSVVSSEKINDCTLLSGSGILRKGLTEYTIP